MHKRFVVDIIRMELMWDVEGCCPYQMVLKIFGTACADPSLYISWDGVHYTEVANRWIANRLINDSL